VDGSEVLRVLEALGEGGVAAGISGGWGVDALLGRQTRPHDDVDLGIDASRLDLAVSLLAPLGYDVTADQRPARVELHAASGRVDLHPIVWRPDGSGIQQGFGDERFAYPPGSLSASGRIDGRAVRCATPELQVLFHSQYEPGDRDRRDMSALAERFGLVLPAPYSTPPG
jgi:lincosamide nucleotidyltransferase A/C/D/E